jgi:NAD(P)-dependent dehydrogenase (short-subunit alcohol dehydrogenase family)
VKSAPERLRLLLDRADSRADRVTVSADRRLTDDDRAIGHARAMKVALVTAASKGIGAACARELKARGYELGLLARGDGIVAIGKELDAVAHQGDVRDEAVLQRLVDAVLARWGRIDAVVGNTGHPPKGGVVLLDDAQWLLGYELVLGSAIRLARVTAPVMTRQRAGAFAWISSYAAARPDVTRPTSTVFRTALGAWVKILAEELAPHNVRANAILPGYLDTQPIPPGVVETIPLGRVGAASELAKMVATLVGPDAGFVTGQSLLVDGGMVR